VRESPVKVFLDGGHVSSRRQGQEEVVMYSLYVYSMYPYTATRIYLLQLLQTFKVNVRIASNLSLCFATSFILYPFPIFIVYCCKMAWALASDVIILTCLSKAAGAERLLLFFLLSNWPVAEMSLKGFSCQHNNVCVRKTSEAQARWRVKVQPWNWQPRSLPFTRHTDMRVRWASCGVCVCVTTPNLHQVTCFKPPSSHLFWSHLFIYIYIAHLKLQTLVLKLLSSWVKLHKRKMSIR